MRLFPGPVRVGVSLAPRSKGSSLHVPPAEPRLAGAYALGLAVLAGAVLVDGTVALGWQELLPVVALCALTGTLLVRADRTPPWTLLHAAGVSSALAIGVVGLGVHTLWPVAPVLLSPIVLWLAAVRSRLEAAIPATLGTIVAGFGAYEHLGLADALGYAAVGAVALVGCVEIVRRLQDAAVSSIETNRQAFRQKLSEGETRLRATEARYRSLIEALPLATYVTGLDGSGAMRYVSPQIEELTGCPVEEWTVAAWVEAIHDEDRERVLAARRYHTQTGQPYRVEYRLRRRDGRELWVLDEAVIEVDRNGRRLHSRGYLQEITERRLLEEQLAHRALHDPLTGLPNRALLLERLHHWASRRQPGPLAILYVDLDDFKYVNDRHGHAAGDEVLAEIAKRLVMAVREEDTVARMGGDEFAVLLEETDSAGAELVADRVVKAIRATPVSVAGTDLAVAASVGVATSVRPGRGAPDVVLNHADMAMYEAKSAGKAQAAVYAVEMGAGAAMRQRMRVELARALDEQEFEVYFQPVVDLVDRSIVGAEALVRWRHPLHGIVSPAKFIDTAVETGQIVAIGRAVLEEACKAAAEVRSRTRAPLWITFNLALRELREPDLVQVVQQALYRHGLPADALVAEITESAFLPDERPTTMRLHALRDIGVRLAIDDFGTGYSSLSYLTRVPADMVKLARPFILALESPGREATLAQSVIRLCSDLGFPTIGEGIETPNQHDLARDLGCPYGQGYLFAKPMPLGQLLRMVETGIEGAASSAIAV